MKREELYKGIIEIEDRYIEEARERKLNRRHQGWKRYLAAAACLCLIAVSAAVLFHGNEQPAAYQLRLYQDPAEGQEATELCTLTYIDHSTDLAHLATRADGTVIPAVFVAADHSSADDEGMTLEEAQAFAYMDLDTAPTELQETIRKAREVIIYSRSWVADGFECYVTAPDGTVETVPAFSELFPDWELPTVDFGELSMTADGLGRDAKYGIFVEVTEIQKDCMLCRATSSTTPFQAGQSLQVYFPAGFDGSGVKKGEIRFVSFYGKACDDAARTVYADEISADNGQ